MPLDQVKTGDVLRVLPGERFPADGCVAANSALVDEQVLTGESRPILKEPGAAILGGTLDLDGDLLILVSAVGKQSALARLVELVKEARMIKGRYQRLVDRISTWFVPLVGAIAVLAFGCPRVGLFVRAGASRRAGRESHRLPVRSGPGNSPGRLECDRPGRQPPGPVSKRRSARASGRGRVDPVRQDGNLDHGKRQWWKTSWSNIPAIASSPDRAPRPWRPRRRTHFPGRSAA